MISRRRRSGFTILELVVSMGVLSVILAATTVVLLRVQQQYTSQRGSTGARDQLRTLELTLSRLFRTARANPRNMAAASVAMIVNPLNRPGTNWDNVELRADFNPVDATVNGNLENVRIVLTSDTVYIRWDKTGALEPAAYPVSELRFQFYALDGTELTTAASAGALARAVKVTIGIPAGESSAIIRRETWMSLRN